VNLAIASGKGGTGKTTVATNLAWLLATSGAKARCLDCDVEEPNGHLFLKPVLTCTEPATIPVPAIDESSCDGCGECVRLCQYRALVRLGKTVMVFDELCHGCGGCVLVCPKKAIIEKEKTIGVVESGTSGAISFVHGLLNVGEAMSPPLIRAVLSHAKGGAVNVIDAPPGTSCPVIASVRDADFVVLVTEPTPFGLNDLGLALDMVGELGVPCGVLINRAEEGNMDAQQFCRKRQVCIIAQIPDDRRIAVAYSRGEMVLDAVPGMREIFMALWHTIRKQVRT
jgi:MinD superfamily P-loop ATPase